MITFVLFFLPAVTEKIIVPLGSDNTEYKCSQFSFFKPVLHSKSCNVTFRPLPVSFELHWFLMPWCTYVFSPRIVFYPHHLYRCKQFFSLNVHQSGSIWKCESGFVECTWSSEDMSFSVVLSRQGLFHKLVTWCNLSLKTCTLRSTNLSHFPKFNLPNTYIWPHVGI